MATAALAYLDKPADDRLEMRLPHVLKAHMEAAALAKGEVLSRYILKVLAERVSEDLASIQEWALTIPEQTELLRILAQSAPASTGLDKATARAKELFGPDL